MTPTETLELIEKLRAMGARRVSVNGVEVEWSAPVAVSAPAERVSPETAARLAREREEQIMFAASG